MSKARLLKPVYTLSVYFLGLLFTLTVIFHNSVPDAPVLAARYVAVIAMVAAVSFGRRRHPENRAIKYLHDFLPLFIVLFTFDSLSHLTHYVNPADRDPALARLDRAIFGTDPALLMQWMINPFLTTVLQICYTSYYFLPVALCCILYYRGDREAFDVSVFGILFGFFVSYAGYILVPALGPRYYINGSFGHDLMRGPLASAIDTTLNMLEGENRDAFPSGHTEIVLIVAIYAWTYRRWYFWAALPFVTGLIISTVYLRYHYAVDVIAGIVLAPLCVLVASALYSRMYRGASLA